MNRIGYKQPWLHNPAADFTWVILPMFLPAVAVILFPHFFTDNAISPGWWLLLIVGVDVSHVYSTLYRTYFDPVEFRKYKTVLLVVPVLVWVAGVALYAMDPMVFWRTMAYLAVFHFVRQQYGFLSLYSRDEQREPKERTLDAVAIYAATLFPLLWWHLHQPRAFHWFVEGDFFAFSNDLLSGIAVVFYALILALWFGKEIRKGFKGNGFNLPKLAVMAGTSISWLTGIVLVNGDLAFTATNVISHGIPYMALIWFYGNKRNLKAEEKERRPAWLVNLFRLRFLPIFILLLLFIGFAEEALWDGMIWRDHDSIFGWVYFLPRVTAQDTLSLLVPLLAVPQVTHYVVDGFIWKVRRIRTEI